MYLDSKDKEYYAEIRRYNSVLKEFPENSHVLRERANCRFWHADWKRAANDFELLLQKNPDDVVLWVMMGQACVHGRLPRQAVTACSRAIELDPDFDLPYMHRAWAYRQLKQWDASIADYTKAIELKRKKRATIHSPMYRGMLYMEMGEYEKAADDFTLAISISRACEGLYVLRGKAYIKMKQYEKVIENANAFMDLDGELDEYLLKQRSYAYKKLGQKDKAEIDLTLSLIKRLNKKRQKEKSAFMGSIYPNIEADIEHEREIKKKEKTILKCTAAIQAGKNDINIYYKRGLAYMELGGFKKAIDDFNKVSRIDPDFSDHNLYHKRAYCYDQINQITKSLNDYEKAISLDPADDMAYSAMADIYNLLGDADKEIACREEVITFDSADFWSIQKLCGLYEETGKYEKAVEARTINLFCSAPALQSWESEGRVYYQSPRIKKLTAALALAPENAALYFLRGNAHDEDRLFKEAVADYTKAISLKPDLLAAYYYRVLANAVLSGFSSGYNYWEKSESSDSKYKQTYLKWKKDEAVTLESMIADLRKVIHLDNQCTFAHLELGRLYNVTGKYKSAISCFTKVLKIEPECDHAYSERSKTFEKMKLRKEKEA